MIAPGPPPDAAVRDAAVSTFDANLVVVAGAGTGKTSLLVERLLVALGSGRIAVDDFAAITFTQKAAGEMRERLADGLARLLDLATAGGEGLGTASAADRAWRRLRDAETPGALVASRSLAALSRLDRATVETIHTFCASLLRTHPIEAGVDPGFEVDRGDRYRLLLDEVWESFVTDELGAAGARAGLWETVLDAVPLASVAEIARALASFAVPSAALEPPFGALDARAVLGPAAKEVRTALAAAASEAVPPTPAAARAIAALDRAFGVLIEDGLERFREFVAGHDDLAKRVPKENAVGKTASQKAAVREALRLAKTLLRTDDGALARVVELAAPFAARAREALLRSGFVGFDGLLVLARDLLRDHPGVREALKRRFRALLIDEFQDTDPLQYEIVLLLGEDEGEAASDAFEARLAPGRLFIVGDPKQSIYRFRGADYAAFDRAVRRILEQGGRRLELVANFRSVREIVEPVNRLFASDPRSAWIESDAQPRYAAIEPTRVGGEGARVEVWTVDDDGGRLTASDRREREGRAIAAEIERLARDRDAPRYARFSILLRAFSNLTLYLRALRERGIPYVVDGGRGFRDRPEVGHLLATLRALACASDEAALLAYLRSPAGGCSDVDLARYRAGGGSWSRSRDLAADEHPRVAAAFRRLLDLERETRDLPADAVVRRVLARSGLEVLGAAAFEGSQRVANLRKVAAAAAGLARDGRLSLLEVLDRLDDGIGADVESESPLADELTDAVRVLTVHKAKGLENDVVIVPDLARREGRSEDDPVRILRLPGGRVAPALSIRGAVNLARVVHDREERAHERAEDLRLLYVALTRARERLIVVAGDPRGRAPWLEALAPWGYAVGHPPADGATLESGVAHRIAGADAGKAPGRGAAPPDEGQAVARYDAAVAAWRRASGPPFRAPSGEETEPRIERSPDDPDGPGGPASSRDVARAAGTLVHRALESWDRRDPEALPAHASAVAEGASEARDRRDEVLAEVREIVTRVVRSGLAARLAEIEVLGREVPLLLPEVDGPAWRGAIDLIYRDGDGRVVVADYKTDRDDDPDALAARYGGQLAVYARAVRDALGLSTPPALELWHLRSGRRITIP